MDLTDISQKLTNKPVTSRKTTDSIFCQWWKKAIKTLLPFPTMYFCEAVFSSHTSTQATYHKRSSAETDRRIQLLSIRLVICKMSLLIFSLCKIRLFFIKKNVIYFNIFIPNAY